jgi:hypothetical protein
MKIIRMDPNNRKQVRDFLWLPGNIYRNIPQWVPPLRRDERRRLDQKRYPFFRHSEAAFFLAYQDNIPVGRLAILDNRLHNEHNHEKTAFFYLFESENDPAIAHLLFEEAFLWAKARGLDRVFGPRGFTALDGYGLLIKGFERRPALGLPYNPPYYPGLLESIGFQTEEEIASGYLGVDIIFPERIHELATLIQERRGLKIIRFQTRRELRGALKHLKNLYNEVLEGSTGGTPITDEEIQELSEQLLWFADPSLIKIIMKEQRPVGFLLAYPDISRAFQATRGRLFPFGWLKILLETKRTDWININGAGMIPEFQGVGGTAILYNELFSSVKQNPRYRHAEIVQIGMQNNRMQREMENFGIDFYKVHRTYSRNLNTAVY